MPVTQDWTTWAIYTFNVEGNRSMHSEHSERCEAMRLATLMHNARRYHRIAVVRIHREINLTFVKG
jgi:hypothetical protein